MQCLLSMNSFKYFTATMNISGRRRVNRRHFHLLGNNYTLFPCQGLICYISSLIYKRNREMNFKIVILRTHSKQDIDFCLNYSTVIKTAIA